jgi:hypothetical protein
MAFIYAFCINSLFGGNWIPETTEELLAEGILILIICFATLMLTIEKHIKDKGK